MKSRRPDARGDLFGMKRKTRIGFWNIRTLTWLRTIEDELKGTRRSWNEVKEIVGDGINWKLFTDTLCSTRSKRT
jgi:hypothetical protein